MTNITECGDIMINAYMDEWGRRRINSLLEDGIKIIVVVPPPPLVVVYRVVGDGLTWVVTIETA
jgi:hypothetical protein